MKKLWKLLGAKDSEDIRARKKGSPGFILVMVALAVFNFVVFYFYVNIQGVIIAFQDSQGNLSLENIKIVIEQLISSDGILLESLKNTLIYWAVGYFIIQSVNIIESYFFYKKIRGYKFFRAIFYVHNIIGSAVMAMIYRQIIGPDGPIIQLAMKFGWMKEVVQLLSDSRYAMSTSVGFSLWLMTGGTMLWASGAMARIPNSLLEAAELDGITPFKEFTSIILPSISGTLSTLYMIGLCGIFYAGGATLFLTEGNYGTMTFSFWMFKQLYEAGNTNLSAALALLLTAATIPIVFLARWIFSKITTEVEY